MIHNKRGIIELTTQKSGVFFTTASLKELSLNFQNLGNMYDQTQDGLVKEIVGISGELGLSSKAKMPF